MWLSLNYDLFKSWNLIASITLAFELVFQSIVYLHPENLDWMRSEHFSWTHTLQFIIIDQFLIECITVAILLQLLRIYGDKLHLNELRLDQRKYSPIK